MVFPYCVVDDLGTEFIVGGFSPHGKALGKIQRIEFVIEEMSHTDKHVSDEYKRLLDDEKDLSIREKIWKEGVNSGGISINTIRVGWYKAFRIFSEKGFMDVPLEKVRRVEYKFME